MYGELAAEFTKLQAVTSYLTDLHSKTDMRFRQRSLSDEVYRLSDLINATVADDSDALEMMGAAEVKLMVTRNTDHLEIQAAKDWYSESSNNKSSYDAAVAAGKAYVAG